MSTQTVTSHSKLSGSFKRPGAVYSVWLFVDLWGSSTSLDTFRSFGVPGYAAPVSMDPYDACHIGEYSHQWSPAWVSPWQLVSACAIVRCWGPCRRDHADTSRSPAARPPATLVSEVGLNPCMWWALFWRAFCDQRAGDCAVMLVNIAELSAVNSPTRRLWRLDYMSTGLPVAGWIY